MKMKLYFENWRCENQPLIEPLHVPGSVTSTLPKIVLKRFHFTDEKIKTLEAYEINMNSDLSDSKTVFFSFAYVIIINSQIFVASFLSLSFPLSPLDTQMGPPPRQNQPL